MQTPDQYLNQHPTLERAIVAQQITTREDSDERIVEGIGVPFGEVYDLGFFKEEFDRDCTFDGLERAKAKYQHDKLIGLVVTATRELAGIRIGTRISKTPSGDEAYTLARDGALDAFSIGFTPLEWTQREDGTVVYTKVRVHEFSLVSNPAYRNALVTNVRHNQPDPGRTPTMSDTLTRDELDAAIVQTRQELTREHEATMAKFAEQLNTRGDQPIGTQWRSGAEFLKAVAKGDPAALEFHRAYTGGVYADTATPATWIADAIKLVEERRRQINSFTQAPLPPEGMTLEYLKLKSNSILVAQQAAEGDDLVYGGIELESATAPVRTYGGYTSLSRQAIERAPQTYLNTAFSAMGIGYAKATETAFKAVLAATVTAQITAGNDIELAATPDVFDWLDLITDAAEEADDRGFQLTGLKVSKAKFKELYRIADSNGDPLMLVSGTGQNRVGTLRAGELSADLANIPVTVVQGAADSFATFYDPVALSTWEQPGAPLQLQDENIINLSKDFSMYGYVAFASQYPTALIPVTFGA